MPDVDENGTPIVTLTPIEVTATRIQTYAPLVVLAAFLLLALIADDDDS